jgi:hypothetical protein
MEYIMVHFQGWKHSYIRYTAQAPPLDANMLVVSHVGLVVSKLFDTPSNAALRISHTRLPTFAEIIKKDAVQGRLSPQDLYSSDGTLDIDKRYPAIRYPGKVERKVFPRLAGSKLIDTLREAHKESSSLDVLELRTDYCVVFKSDLSNCGCELIGSELSLVQLAAGASSVVSQSLDPVRGVYEHGLTVISVGWAGEVASSTAPLVYASLESGVGAGVGVGLVLDMVSVLV